MAQAVRTKTVAPQSPKPDLRAALRHAALQGGTTTFTDCLVGLRLLADPRALEEGPAITEYEQAFAQLIGVRYAFSFAHGRVGLYGLLRVLGVGPGDEVLLQVPTNIVVANAIRYTGAQPVYVDCRLDTYNMDLELARHRITPRTKALVLQHTFGMPADVDGALALAREHGLDVIEDCVHALGASYGGRPIGSLGRAAFFSSEHTKTISTTMGGMVVTDDSEVAKQMAAFQRSCAWPPARLVARYVLKLVLHHVLTQPYVHRYWRTVYNAMGQRHPLPRPTTATEVRGERPANYERRLSNVQAALGLRQLRRLEHNVAHRRVVAQIYQEALRAAGFDVPNPPAAAEPAFVRYPVWVEDPATTVRTARRYASLGTWFTSVLEEAVTPECAGYVMGSCPRAEAAARHLVNLPTNPLVTPEHAAIIVATIVGPASAAVPARQPI